MLAYSRGVSLLIGTSAGAFSLDDTSAPIIAGTRINHLAKQDGSWWALDGKSGIHLDGEQVAEMPPGATPLCIQPTPETVWIGADKGRLFGYEGGSIAEDEFFADAPGRSDWYTPWGAPADVRSMTLDADHTLYINVHVGGILRYDNTGVVPTLDISADVHQVAAHPSQRGAIFAATAHGLAQTRNGHDFDFRTNGLHAKYCRAVLVLDDLVLVSASTGPSTSKGRLYRAGLWEGPFEPVVSGLPDWFDENLNTHCIAQFDGSIFVGVGTTVWVSDDLGVTWETAATGLAKITCLA